MPISNRTGVCPVLASIVIIIGLLCNGIDSVVLRSSDGVLHRINTSTAVAQSQVLHHLISDVGESDDPVPVPNVANVELEPIVEYMNNVTDDKTGRATELARDSIGAMALEDQCRLLEAADYLIVQSLIHVIAAGRSWADIRAMREFLPTNCFWLLLYKAQSTSRLNEMADTNEQKAIARQVLGLLVHPGNATVVNRAEWSPHLNLLHWAVVKNEETVVELLLKVHGIDVNARGHIFSETPLHLAAVMGHSTIVKLLLKAPGVDVNARDVSLLSPLHYAVTTGQTAIVELLLNAPGIDIDARDDKRETPLRLTTRFGHDDIIRLLRDARRPASTTRRVKKALSGWLRKLCLRP
ncbi:SKP1 component POZ domain-containing protein [Plasmodiophora brassicae]